jgi:hypothetical protein
MFCCCYVIDAVDPDEVDDLYTTHDDNQPGINMYAGNLVNHIGGVLSPPKDPRDLDSEQQFDDEESAISEYDPSKKSQILSMHGEIMKHVTEETSSYSSQFTFPSGK